MIKVLRFIIQLNTMTLGAESISSENSSEPEFVGRHGLEMLRPPAQTLPISACLCSFPARQEDETAASQRAWLVFREPWLRHPRESTFLVHD